ncbi:MAG: hypothetical protein JSS27_02735 [Planctomycetes bacterium]|nr:hypothetical protein [Planctomycetota bacterium]
MGTFLLLLLITVLAGHLLLANLATGGPFVCLWLQRRASGGDVVAGRLVRQMAGWSLGALILAAATGLMQMLLVAKVYPQVFYATVALIAPSRYYASAGELVFSILCYGVYFALVGPGLATAGNGKRIGAGLLALLGALNTAWHFPTLFALLNVMSTRPEMWDQGPIKVTSGLADGEVMALAIHFLFAAAAVAGLVLTTFALQSRQQPPGDAERRYGRVGGLIAVVPTVLQIGAGLWLVMETAEPARKLIMGRDMRATAIFLMATVAALMLMHRLATLALGRQKPNVVRNAWSALIATVWMMCAVQQLMRHHQYNDARGEPVPAAVEPAAAPEQVRAVE